MAKYYVESAPLPRPVILAKSPSRSATQTGGLDPYRVQIHIVPGLASRINGYPSEPGACRAMTVGEAQVRPSSSE